MKSHLRFLQHSRSVAPVAVATGMLGCLLFSAPCAHADGLAELNKYRERYLLIDSQSFSEVTCKIRTPTLQSLVDQMATLPPAIRATNTLKDFSLTLRKGEPLSIVFPTLDIVLVDKNSVADPATVEQGITMTKRGFQQAASGAAGLVQGVFDDLRPPREGMLKSVKVRAEGTKLSAEYSRGKVRVTETYDSSTHHRLEESPAGKAESTLFYQELDGKLALQTAKVAMGRPAMNGNNDITITYQKLGAIQFPASLTSVAHYDVDGKQQDAKVEITFTDCEVKAR